jgi:hypothetical protein
MGDDEFVKIHGRRLDSNPQVATETAAIQQKKLLKAWLEPAGSTHGYRSSANISIIPASGWQPGAADDVNRRIP